MQARKPDYDYEPRVIRVPDIVPTTVFGEKWLEGLIENHDPRIRDNSIEDTYRLYLGLGGTLSYEEFAYVLREKPSPANLSKSGMENQRSDGVVQKFDLVGHYIFANLLSFNGSNSKSIMQEVEKILIALGRKTKK